MARSILKPRQPSRSVFNALGHGISTLGSHIAQAGSIAILRFNHAARVRRERRALLRLDDRLLKDIGISRAQAEGEAERSPFDCNRWDRGPNQRGFRVTTYR